MGNEMRLNVGNEMSFDVGVENSVAGVFYYL